MSTSDMSLTTGHLKSGHFTCQLDRTYHVSTTLFSFASRLFLPLVLISVEICGCWPKGQSMNIDDLLRVACENKASDLHLKVGNYPYNRIDGELAPLSQFQRISSEDMLNMAFSMMSNRQKQKFKEETELDMAYGVAGLGRFRVNVFQQRGNVGMVLRVIPTKIRTLDELFMPTVLDKICEARRGIVLVTGTTGSGKSTTLAAMIDRVNSSRTDHIITIEDPIEFLHRDKK